MRDMQKTVLIVEDDSAICSMVSYVLSSQGFAVYEANNASSGFQKVKQTNPDIALVDWMMPNGSGIDLIKKIKRQDEFADLPIIMLTAKSEEADKVQGLDAGADDYITKPFSPRELTARINALLRRLQGNRRKQKIQFLALTLDNEAHRCLIGDDLIELAPTEFKLLHFLLSNMEHAFSRSQLLDNVWGYNVRVEDRTVDVHVLRLRKALAAKGYARYLQTVRGVGYRMSLNA